MNQNLNERYEKDVLDEFDFRRGMKCADEYERMMFEESRKSSWDRMRARVARETGQDPSDTMRYYPPKK